MSNESLTPTRFGNWHVIDGKLVDLDQVKPAEKTPEPEKVPDPEPVESVSPRKRF